MAAPNRISKRLAGPALLALLVGCGGDAPPAENSVPDEVQVTGVARSVPSMGDAGCDAERAVQVFEQCKVCHSADRDAANLTGPNLFGIVGRPAASLDGFAYSKVLRESGIVWSAETLEEFLAKPLEYLPNNRMAFGGVTNPEDRKAVICLLTTLG